MAAFRLNHKKMIASHKSGAGEDEIHRPIWPYYDALATFMSDVYECKSILNTENRVSKTICNVINFLFKSIIKKYVHKSKRRMETKCV